MSVRMEKTDVGRVSPVGCGGTIERAFYPTSIEELAETSRLIGSDDRIVLGGVSNVLVLSSYAGSAVFCTGLKGLRFDGTRVKVGGGVATAKWSLAVRKANLGGAEEYCDLPGTIGGAICGNAGCFDNEISRFLTSVELFRLDDGEIETLHKEEIAFSYRHSNLRKNTDVIVSATFDLYEEDPRALARRVAFCRKERREKTPRGKSLGCFFRRVDGVSAGYYIENAGLKGTRVGGAVVSQKHADFFLNEGGTPEEYLALSETVRKEVKNRSGVRLEREVIVVGEEYQRDRSGRTV